MQNLHFDIIIPTYDPGEDFGKLLRCVSEQTVLPDRVIVVNTDISKWKAGIAAAAVEGSGLKLEISHINKSEFNHGKTRNSAAALSEAPYFICMTQDAVPRNGKLFEKLLSAFYEDKSIKISYARQIAKEDAGDIEKITREFNYPGVSMVKSAEDKKRLGVKAYFCSNVCAAYERETFDALGGFAETSFNEDMIYAAGVLEAGFKIKYCADAEVCHSHELSGPEQIKRNILIGRTQKEHPEIFGGLRSEGEGARLIKESIKKLAEKKKIYLVPELIYLSACKYIGYRIGKNR